MGNSFPTCKWITVGTNARIKFERADIVKWTDCPHVVSYYVNGKVVRLALEIQYDYSPNIERQKKYGSSYWKKKLHIRRLKFIFGSEEEPYGSIFSFFIRKDRNDLLNEYGTKDINEYYELKFVNETKNRWGGVTKTNVYYRGVENEGNLLVVQHKRKKGDEQPCAITVTHYYAFSRQRFINRKKYEVGLSIVVDIRVLDDDDLGVSMKGPIEHPALALLQMFQQVSRTWSWKWTACSHCAAQTHMQQSETETDDEEIKNLQSSREIGGNILANQGVINGNNNGNLVVKNLFLRGPR